MKMTQTKAQKLRYSALCWLRFIQRCPFIATEVGSFSADVLGINEKKIIEIEIKISASDLKADIRKHKHRNYTKTGLFDYGQWNVQWIPNQFYYAVPEELVEKAKQFLEEHKLESYGIISLDGFSVIKRAKKIHEREPNAHVKFALALRMGSELLKFHESWV